MPDEIAQLEKQLSAMLQADVAWEWSIDWLARQHANVPGNLLVQGVLKLGLTPRRVVNGEAFFDGDQYLKLSKWLVAEARRIAEKFEQVSE